jgi:hypothetical protein
MSTHRTFPVEARHPHISYPTYLFLVSEVQRLERALAIAEASADHWYLRANYTREELAEMYRRASLGLDENGAWLWPDNLRTTASGQMIDPDSGPRS